MRGRLHLHPNQVEHSLQPNSPGFLMDGAEFSVWVGDKTGEYLLEFGTLYTGCRKTQYIYRHGGLPSSLHPSLHRKILEFFGLPLGYLND